MGRTRNVRKNKPRRYVGVPLNPFDAVSPLGNITDKIVTENKSRLDELLDIHNLRGLERMSFRGTVETLFEDSDITFDDHQILMNYFRKMPTTKPAKQPVVAKNKLVEIANLYSTKKAKELKTKEKPKKLKTIEKVKSKPVLVRATKKFLNVATSTRVDFPEVERLTNYNNFTKEYYETVGQKRNKEVRYETALASTFTSSVINSLVKTINASFDKNGPISVKFVMAVQSLKVDEKIKNARMFSLATKYEREDSVGKQTITQKLMQNDDLDNETTFVYLHTKKSFRLFSKLSTVGLIRQAMRELNEKSEIADRLGSGRILFVNSIHVKTFKFDPKKGGTYCELPQKIKDSQACVNPQNGKDNECMKWAILAGLYPKERNAGRISQYKKEQHLINFSGIEFPVSSEQFDVIEQQNDFSFHVFECDSDGNLIQNLYISQCVGIKSKHVNLLLFNGHFCLIRKLDTFLKCVSNDSCYSWNCEKCLSSFTHKSSYDKHIKTNCGSVSDIEMPTESKLRQIKIRNLMPSLIRVYAQFDKKFENDIQVITGFKIRIVYDSVYDFSQWFKKNLISYSGENVFVEFAKRMDSINQSIYSFTEHFTESPFKICLTKKERENVNKGVYKNCHICKKAFTKNQVRVEDHDHFKDGNNFRGLACQGCNLHYKALYGGIITIPVIVYDWTKVSSDITFALNSAKRRQNIIGKSINDIIAFRDSNLIYKNFSNFFANTDIDETHAALPESSKQFNDMKFADIFENTRKLNIDLFKLDICHYYSLYSYAYDCAIHNKDAEIHLPLDNEIMYYFKNNIVGGICTTGGRKRYAKANNKYMKSFDHSQESSFIMPFDINASYVATMMKNKFPVSDYELINESEFSKFTNEFILSLPSNGDYCYSFDIEADYPKELHDKHADFPIMPRRREIVYDEMSEFNRNNIENFGSNTQLCVTLEKFEGAVDFRLLQFWIKRGITNFKIKRIIKSKQEFVFKTFMESNYERRQQAKRDKDTALDQTIKLTLNSVFGYTCKKENEKKQFKIWSEDCNVDELKKHIDNTLGIDLEITDDEKHLITCKTSTKAKSVITSPYQIGFTILQLSKLSLYEFFYAMKDFYGDNIALLYTDTDSLYVEIKTDDVFADFKQNQCIGSFISETVAGKFKYDVSDDSIITEFVGISAKMYSYSTDTKQVCKMAGVGKKFVPGIDSYRNCVNGLANESIKVKMQVKQSSNGTMVKDVVKNVDRNIDILNASNIKVYQISNNESLPYGHYKISSI